MLNSIKILLDISNTNKDELLTLLIDTAIEEATAYTHNDNLDELRSAIAQMVIYKYNRLGTEGVDSESYTGVTYAYTDDYPESIMRVLKSKRKIVLC